MGRSMDQDMFLERFKVGRLMYFLYLLQFVARREPTSSVLIYGMP